jgi:excisionase family DNA binding protein
MATSRSTMPMSGRLYSCREAAKVLDVSDDTIRRLIDSGKLEAVRIGKRCLRVLGESLERCINSPTEGSRIVCHGKATCYVHEPPVPNPPSGVKCGCQGGAA